MVYSIENEVFFVSVDTLGAQLKSIYSKDSKIEYLWQGDSAFWSGRAYNLFPYVGRLAGGKYVVEGKEYAMDRHGFARGMQFCLTEKTNSSMTLAICSTDDTKSVYPFEFIFKVTFAIDGKKLTVSYDIKNIGKNTMYYGLGGHPGFNVPFDGGEFEDYRVEFESECAPVQIIANDKGLITEERKPLALEHGRSISLKHSLFDNDAIIMNNTCGVVCLKGKNTDKQIKISYKEMKNLGIWHMPKTNSPFVCIEPWMTLPANDGNPEELETKENIGKILSGESSQIKFEIEILD